MNPFYQKYLDQVQNMEIEAALVSGRDALLAFFEVLPPEKINFRYAPGKWTVKEVFGHIIDTERVFAYRALRFARGDKTELPGFDQEAYVPEMNLEHRTLGDMLVEYQMLRESSLYLFRSFSPAIVEKVGTASGTEFTVKQQGLILAGHERHHLQILQERYLANPVKPV
ncbi:MAG: DinB family protein [Bacteroidota bacterium]